MRVGVARVRKARRQKLCRDFEIEYFSLRLAGFITELQSLGGMVTELDAVQKSLHVVPPRYSQMAARSKLC